MRRDERKTNAPDEAARTAAEDETMSDAAGDGPKLEPDSYSAAAAPVLKAEATESSAAAAMDEDREESKMGDSSTADTMAASSAAAAAVPAAGSSPSKKKGASAAPNSSGSAGGGGASHYPFGHPSSRAYSGELHEATTTQVKWVYRAVNFLTDLFFGVDKELDHLPEKRKSVQPTTRTGADMLAPAPSFLPPDISAGYGELSWHGFDKVFNYMHNECPSSELRIGARSRFLDIGSGFGKCVLHAKLRGKVARSVGIECIKTRHEKALEALHLLRAGFVPGLSDAKDAPDFEAVRNLDLSGCELFEGDITQPRFHPLLRTATHIYAFDVVFSKDTHRKILPLISQCNFSLFGTYLAPAKVAALGGTNMQPIHSVKVHTTGKQSFTCWFYVKTPSVAPSVPATPSSSGSSADPALDPDTDEFYQSIRDQAPHTPEHVLHANALAAAAEAAAAARAKAALTVPAPARKSKPARSDSSSSPDSPSPSPSPSPPSSRGSHKKGARAAERRAAERARSRKKKPEAEPPAAKRSHQKKQQPGSSGTKRKHTRKPSVSESESSATSSSEHCSSSSSDSFDSENEDDLPLAELTPAQVAAREAKRVAREARKTARHAQRLARHETRRERLLTAAAESKPAIKPLTKSQLWDQAMSSAYAPKPAAARRTNNSTALKLEPLQVHKLPRELSHYLADATTAVVKAGQIQLEQGAELMVVEGTDAAAALALERSWQQQLAQLAPAATVPVAQTVAAASASTAAAAPSSAPAAASVAASSTPSNSKRKQQKTSHSKKKK